MTETTTQLPEPQMSDNVVALPARSEPTTPDKAAAVVRDHPIASIAGGVVAGIVISALLPRRPAHKLAERAVSLAEAASAASIMLGKNVMDQAEAAGHEIRGRVGDFAHRAERLGHRVAGKAEGIGHAAYGKAENLGYRAKGRAESLGSAARSRVSGLLPRRKPQTLAQKVAQRAEELADILRR